MNRNKKVEILIDVLENCDIEDAYDRMNEHKEGSCMFEIWENIIKWKLGLREHPFTINQS